MGKGRPRAVERGGGLLGQISAANGSMNITPAPVYYPTEEDFRDPLEFIYKIRPEAEPFGICKIVPPEGWKPPFALDVESFSFPTKTQAIHQLQARPASCDSKTFELEYNRFLETHCGGRKPRRKVVFEGEELDLCKVFNAVKRFGGYDKVAKEKKWGEVFRFVRPKSKISECAKHVLGQLYLEHLYDYEEYYSDLNKGKLKGCKRGIDNNDRKRDQKSDLDSLKKKRKNDAGDAVKVSKPQKEEERDQICEQCKSGLHGEVMLLCDRCNKGWHIYCLSPPLEAIPPGNWYCLECLNSDEDSFGFVPGKCLSLEAFRKVADRTKKKWFGSASCSRMQLEKKFWEIVGGSLGEVEVMYGSDLDTSIYGSGFPRSNDKKPESVDAEVWNKYCNSPWNLNNLPKLKGSMLRAVHHSIAGVMVPWLYIGMLFSAFCWHFEDHCFYSMNYHHWGEPKCWYSVPGSEASAFEKVMRSCLPDLFDAQPDLLFQLVTMLNPSVLEENGVPVYTVLQEPGNFVITFPRSYHGGFNLGLNCAEAVNFAPADWLPHGGFGSELYQLYHKPAVLSHEELLCVAVKLGCDAKVAPYMNKELLRVFTKEKNGREQLWKKGLVKTSVMSPRKHPEYVGTEEDPTCIICQQYLYLSAVVCRCRPSTFVCLEHWERLCECNPRRCRLRYRHSLAELNELLVITKNVISGSEDNGQGKDFAELNTCSTDSGTLTKKVKGKQISLAQLAEDWLLNSCKISKLPFSSSAYRSALKEAQQFLWAGPEMDPVRDVEKNLVQAKDWAEGIRKSLSAVESWSKNGDSDMDKVHLEYVNNLLGHDPVPCNEPGLFKLKEYADAARLLVQDINNALSELTFSMDDLENLLNQTLSFPIYIKESEKLAKKISSLKVWLDNVKKCVFETSPAAIDFDFLRHLKTEMSELRLNVPENEMLLELIGQAELCQDHCNEMLKGSIALEKLEILVQEFGDFVVNIPELKILQQYHSDTVSWISRFNNILLNINKREDQENVVEELRCIQRDGSELRVQVDELALVDAELSKACCREKALKVHKSKMRIDFVQQVLSEAAVLQIDREELFVSLYNMRSAAISWEDRATEILADESTLEDFEDAIRTSEDIYVILPSLPAIKEAVSAANSWIKSSRPFLQSAALMTSASTGLLAFENLKELVCQSKCLNVKLEEKMLIETVLKNCEEWRCCACSSLKDVEEIFDRKDIFNGLHGDVIVDIEQLRSKVENVADAGQSLGFDFPEISILWSAASTLKWCSKVLMFRFELPSIEDVDNLIKEMKDLPTEYDGAFVLTSLVDAASWLSRASEVLSASSSASIRRFHLTDADDILMKSQDMLVSFPTMIVQLEQAIEKHKSWQEDVRAFFSDDSSERCWSSLLELKELGKDAFNCPELDMVMSEFDSIGNWKQQGGEVVGCSAGDVTTLLSSLLKIKQSLHRSLYIYEKSTCWKVRYFCIGCSSNSDDEEFITCSTCKDCYHLRCLIPKSVACDNSKVYTCPYCALVDSGSICRSKDSPLRYKGKRPELEKLVELSSDAKKFTTRLEEYDVLQEILDQALACRGCLSEIVDSSLSFFDKDVSSISGKLTIALKALDVAGVCDSLAIQKFDQALARNSWRIRASRLIEGSQKPVMQQLQRHLKEGFAIKVPLEDYFKQKLVEVKQIGLQWAEMAKKVASDNGDLELDKVFELIAEGESLPIHFEKELKLLRGRSVLYCICRKPYDMRPMIACDECDEWYHFDCVNLISPPDTYICPACEPHMEGKVPVSPSVKRERSQSAKDSEPQTPSPRHVESRWRLKKGKSSKKRKACLGDAINSSSLVLSNGFDELLWRNKKPYRRTVKKRTDLGSLSPFFLLQQ
ncbi:lysine-specific demethylase 5D-like [Chenopodium quinoa]|uniref:Lysine-specific demethylase 5B n=1 Tax=Chenopodium quinoa TaxID=63459 RepID=A0A803LQI4_CHEQI|nr:lysine-specific demethylase 5D-like [Chenopodium quinoa]